MHGWRISFTVLLVYSRHFPKPEPDPKPGFCGLPNPKPGFSKKATGLESLVVMSRMSAGNTFQASGAAVENDLDPKAVRERGMSCITRRPLSTHQISLKSEKKLFVDGWTDILRPALWDRRIFTTGCMGLRRGVFACVGWQVTLYDPIWQATPCSSEMGFPRRTYSALTV